MSRSIIIVGYLPALRNRSFDFGVCKIDALTGMKCTREYGPASPLTETLNCFVSRVFSRTFMTLRRPTREEPVASANDFSSYLYDEIMRVIFAGCRQSRSSSDAKDIPKRNPQESPSTLLITLRRTFFHGEALKVDKYIIAPIWYDKYVYWSSLKLGLLLLVAASKKVEIPLI